MMPKHTWTVVITAFVAGIASYAHAQEVGFRPVVIFSDPELNNGFIDPVGGLLVETNWADPKSGSDVFHSLGFKSQAISGEFNSDEGFHVANQANAKQGIVYTHGAAFFDSARSAIDSTGGHTGVSLFHATSKVTWWTEAEPLINGHSEAYPSAHFPGFGHLDPGQTAIISFGAKWGVNFEADPYFIFSRAISVSRPADELEPMIVSDDSISFDADGNFSFIFFQNGDPVPLDYSNTHSQMWFSTSDVQVVLRDDGPIGGNAFVSFSNPGSLLPPPIGVSVEVLTVPEPSTFVLAALGALGMLIAARRRC